MFIKRMFFILTAVITAAPMFGAVERIINANARDRIENQYIVIFAPKTDLTNVTKLEGEITKGQKDDAIQFRYRQVLLGFAATIPSAKLTMVRNWPGVVSIEANILASPAATLQRDPPRGIDRIDQRLLLKPNGLNGQYQYTETGEGVNAYVIDTGILSNHTEFTGRRSPGYSAFGNHTDTTDCNGHGTHVAGTVGGTTYGIAKKVTLVPVRVLDCGGYGSEATILAGVEWVTLDVQAKKRPAVANLSLRLTGPSPALESAIQKSIDEKITYVVAAGNLLGGDACNYSPAHLEPAITVGSVDPTNDRLSVLSAIGVCIDLFAPGVRILSATVSGGNNDASEIMSGTSMAAAHVTGVAALYLQNHQQATPLDVWNAIHRSDDVADTPDWPGIGNLDRGPCSPNEMLHWGPRDDGFNDGDSSGREKTIASNQ
jgi:subtilisin family serine protease